MQQARSNFVTPAGLVILAVFALFSAYIGAGLLFALLGGIFLVCFISWIWTRNSLKNLVIDIKEPEVFAYPGEDLDVSISIANDKMLPLVWLRAAFPLKESQCVKFAEEDAATFSWVMPHQKLSWVDGYKAVKRGVCTLSSAELSSGDGFGLSDASKELGLETPLRLVVFPEHVDVDVNFLLRKLTELEPSSKGLYTDPTLIRNVRDIQPYDSMRDINWRLLAREGKLQVNVREKLDTRRTAFLLDLESYSETEKVESNTGARVEYHVSESLEKSISVIGSAITALTEKGVRCSFIIPGYTVKTGPENAETKRRSRLICPEQMDSQQIRLLTALSEIDYQGGPAEVPYSALGEESHELGQIFLFAAKPGETAALAEDAAGTNVWSITGTESLAERCIQEKELLL